ncbi:Transcription factor TFIIIB component B [Xylographa opegraphella]|nr:Transcription factor TFIIIB component B [Xylographa opegraphella]
MASAVSSYLSKSKKDFKPKAPTRRPAAAGSNPSLVHDIAEQQVGPQSHTRQDLATQPAILTSAALTKTALTSSTDTIKATGSNNLRQSSQVAAASNPQNTTQDAIPGPEVAREPDSAPVVAPSPETSDTNFDVENAVAINLPRTKHSYQQSKQHGAPISTNGITSNQLTATQTITEAPPPTVTTGDTIVSTHGLEDPTSQPAAKRRKTNPPEKVASTPQAANVLPKLTQPMQADHGQENSIELAVGSNNGTTMQVAKPQKTKQTAKAKGKRRMEGLAAAVVADATRGDGESGDRSNKRRERSTATRKRAHTPENAESLRIEPGVVTMADLCQDNRAGKKSKRETALQARDAKELSAKKTDVEQLSVETEVSSDVIAQRQTANADADTGTGDSNRSQLRALVPSVRIVNGQLVHDESSRTIDRVALANEARGDDEAVVVVDSLSHKVNSGTYMKRERKTKWNEAMTDQFYDGLRMFGTDFSMICKMFPGKSRKAVKLKFSKEEKSFPERIKSTLLGEKLAVDMEEFSKLSNTVYKDPKEHEHDMAEDRKRLEEEQAKEKEAMEEAVRERAEEAAAEAAAEASAESAGGGEDSSAKENNARNGDTGVGRKIGGKRAKKASRPAIRRPPVDRVQARKEARAAAKVVARVLRPAPPI